MTAALLDRPPAWTGADRHGAEPLVVNTGQLLSNPVRVETDRPLPQTAERLLLELNQQWDISRRHSDLYRLSSYPGVVLTVSEPTLALVTDALALAAAGPFVQRLAVVDHRHGRAGVDPATAELLVRLIPDTAAGLLAGLCRAAGVRAGRVQIGAAVRLIGEPG